MPLEPGKEASKPLATAPEKHHKRRISPFWRHYLQMAVVMGIGMVASGAILTFAVGLKSWDAVTIQYPTQALLVMAAGMSIPMVAWMLFRRMGRKNSYEMAAAMLFRRMGRKNSYEMAAAMLLPVIPFLCLVWFGITKSALCGPYCVSTFVAMFALMRYRRSEHSMHM